MIPVWTVINMCGINEFMNGEENSFFFLIIASSTVLFFLKIIMPYGSLRDASD